MQACAPRLVPTALCPPAPCGPPPSTLPPGDRQFFFLNGRPVDLPKAAKALNDTYRSLSSPAAASSKPMAVVDFRWAGQGAPAMQHSALQQRCFKATALRGEACAAHMPGVPCLAPRMLQLAGLGSSNPSAMTACRSCLRPGVPLCRLPTDSYDVNVTPDKRKVRSGSSRRRAVRPARTRVPRQQCTNDSCTPRGCC